MLEASEVPSVIITSEGVFLMIVDESDPVNDADFWSTNLSSSERGERVAALSREDRLFLWTMVLDGTFRIQFRAHTTRPARPPLAEAKPFVLSLPTGRLAVRSATSIVRAQERRSQPVTVDRCAA
jgi:hypothetical protein